MQRTARAPRTIRPWALRRHLPQGRGQGGLTHSGWYVGRGRWEGPTRVRTYLPATASARHPSKSPHRRTLESPSERSLLGVGGVGKGGKMSRRSLHPLRASGDARMLLRGLLSSANWSSQTSGLPPCAPVISGSRDILKVPT